MILDPDTSRQDSQSGYIIHSNNVFQGLLALKRKPVLHAEFYIW